VDGQCDKLVTDVNHQLITLTVDVCLHYDGRGALRRAGLSVAAETYLLYLISYLLACLLITANTKITSTAVDIVFRIQLIIDKRNQSM